MRVVLSEFKAIKKKDKNNKIHIIFIQSYMALCFRKFGDVKEHLTIEPIKNMQKLKCIIEDNNICKFCKKEIEDYLKIDFIKKETK